jgi:hypothetical protein
MPIEHVYIARVTDGLILVRFFYFMIRILSTPIPTLSNILFNPQVASMEQGGAQNEKLELFKSQVMQSDMLNLFPASFWHTVQSDRLSSY